MKNIIILSINIILVVICQLSFADINLPLGQPVSSSVSQHEWQQYIIPSDPGITSVTVNLTELSNDVDLYVKAGSQPDFSTYDCRPYNGETLPETCSLTFDTSTTIYISVYGYHAGNFTIMAVLPENSAPTELLSGQPVSSSVSQHEWQQYIIPSDPGITSVTVNLTELSNDVDLYVKAGSQPDFSTYDCRPYNGGTLPETCSLTFGTSTTIYIGVYGYHAGNFTIEALTQFFPREQDSDYDGITNSIDNCPNDSNPNQSDIDEDNIGDICDEYVPLIDENHPYGLTMAEQSYVYSYISNPNIIPFNPIRIITGIGSLNQEFPIFDYDGLGIGDHRNCTPTQDCTPTRDCTFDFIDCTPVRNCGDLQRSHDTRNCSACIFRSPFGGCIVRGNDPFCEASKAAQNAIYDTDYAARKLDCERIKTSEKTACEIDKSARKVNCEAIKSSEKLVCEADKSAQKLDCERLKLSQKAVGEVWEAGIHESKNQALSRNPQPIPLFIRQALEPYFPSEILDLVRWTFGQGNFLDIAARLAFNDGRGAITLDNIIVFETELHALYDIGLWAHELEHVNQYTLLGIDNFAEYYADYFIDEYFNVFNNVFRAANDITPSDVDEFVALHGNKIEALASVKSHFICDKVDFGKSYQRKPEIFENSDIGAGRIVVPDNTVCRPN